MLSKLTSGEAGARIEIPVSWTLENEGHDSVHFSDHEQQLMWWWFLSEDTPMVLHQELRELRADAELHARHMFEAPFRQTSWTDGPKPHQPRTTDPSWSPIIEFDPIELHGARALVMVHRMTYHPGSEIIMGHLLIPLRAGTLLEARVVAGANFTGVRETSLLAAQADPEEGMSRLKQADYDAPSRDADFPEHPLSRIRAALRWLRESTCLTITAPAEPLVEGELELAQPRCVLTPPSRFVPLRSDPGALRRVSFCATDGIEHLLVQFLNVRSSLAELPEVVRLRAPEELELPAEQLTFEPISLAPSRSGVLVTGHRDDVERHAQLCYFLDGSSQLWMISLSAPDAIPLTRSRAELLTTAESCRPLERAPRPWWKLW